jgi:hypothetical protein
MKAHENLLAPRRQERQGSESFFFLCGLCVFARFISFAILQANLPEISDVLG